MQTQPPFQPCRSRSSTKSQSSMRQLGECAWTGPGGLLAATPDRARQNQRPDAKSGGTLQVAGILRCLRRALGLARLAKWTPRLSRRRITTSGNKSVMGRVELHAAKIPSLPGIIADHYWLLVFHAAEGSMHQECDRWEVWQRANQNETCWGHLHKNLLTPYQGVGNGPSRLIQQWEDEEALSMAKRIESSPQAYPFINQYKYWPGPNSNTFAQWVVRGKAKLGIRAIGRNFPVPLIHQGIQNKRRRMSRRAIG